MPPRTRTRANKLQKENIDVVKISKIKTHEKVNKPTRKALGDKTNSLSDSDATNSSIKPRSKIEEIPSKPVRTLKKDSRIVSTLPEQTTNDAKVRSKRSCRVKPVKDMVTKASKNHIVSPFKTPLKNLESSLVANRPKRICKLPSKFDDHFISPTKLSPVQPCHASTPIQHKKPVKVPQSPKPLKIGQNSGNTDKVPEISVPEAKHLKKNIVQKGQANSSKANEKFCATKISIEKPSPDTNNNGKKVQPRRVAKLKTKKSPEVNKNIPFTKRLMNKSASFRILEDRSDKSKNLDVYEFTFDPNEEPTPQKKKKRKVVRKKPPKPKTVGITVPVPTSKYDDNIAKALTNLKSQLKPQLKTVSTENVQKTQPPKELNIQADIQVPSTKINTLPLNKELPQSNKDVSKSTNEAARTSLHESNYASIRVEDIAADFELDDSQNNVNYSPVNTPARPKTPNDPKVGLNSKDPLNLQDGSFFDGPPVASSSMNISRARGDPIASPWRVEFGNLPIKWHANTYVKPNMTPAVECSFINAEDLGKKRHVYTNIVADEPPPQIEEQPSLKQTSIISFMKEVAERSAKKKRKRSVSPTKASYFFDDVTNPEFGHKTPKKAKKSATDTTADRPAEKSGENVSKTSNKSSSPSKNKNKDKEHTYFGFDDSEMDQENLSPEKVPNTRTKRVLRPRGALQECNQGPTRPVIPGKAKLTSSEVVKHLYDQLKSADDAPHFPEDAAMEPTEKQITNIEESVCNDNDNDDSVHLFEDIELIHHLKPHRKSYSKPKKVAFQRYSNSDSDTEDAPRVEASSSDEDDLADLSFHLPNVKEKKVNKKKKKKNLLSKKEEKEAEEWAAGFNSMCEDIEEFPLIVE